MDSPNLYLYTAMLTEQQPFLGKHLTMFYGNFIVVFERAQIHLPHRFGQIVTEIGLMFLSYPFTLHWQSN